MIETIMDYKIEVAQGQTYVEVFSFSDDDGPVSFIGYTGEAAVTDLLQENVWPCVVTINNTEIKVVMETEATGGLPAIPAGRHIFTLGLTETATGYKDIYVNGLFIVYRSAL